MKRYIVLLSVLIAACGVDISQIQQLSGTGFCGTPPQTCMPIGTVVNGNAICDSACRSAGYQTGFCPSYTDTDYKWCLDHAVPPAGSYPGKCVGWTPIWPKQCVGGSEQ